MKILLIANIFSTVYLTGVIWLIQLVQYPYFVLIGREDFQEYHASHSFWIPPVVAPMMIVELFTSVFLVLYPAEHIDAKLFWLGLLLTMAIWASTFFLQVPMHEKLAGGFDSEVHAFLVNSNWIRTIAWSLRSFLVVYFVWKTLK